MTLEQLRVFIAVAEHLHFTRASEALCLTQPAVSSAIASLENHCKTLLFHRIGRRIELTSAGKHLLKEAKLILQQVAAAEFNLKELSGLHQGQICIWASQAIAHNWITPFILDFHRTHPKICINLQVANTAQVMQALVDGGAEIGLIDGHLDHPSIQREVIAEDEIVIIVGAKHQWYLRPQLPMEELSQSAWVVRETGSGARQFFENECINLGLLRQQLDIPLELPTCPLVKSAVLSGLGAAMISKRLVQHEVEAKKLHSPRVTGKWPLIQEFCLLTHKIKRSSKAGIAFIQLMRQSISSLKRTEGMKISVGT